ncbi:response regulator transcription factor [Gemmatimonas sp.]|jgi:two-component system response regulator FixJ|uniref:response regulator transcription factor n=1 Tax=Gemmatimonas sp. TaxID=1962908 RepID=UPI0037BF86DC
MGDVAEMMVRPLVAVVDDDDAARVSLARLLDVAEYRSVSFDSGTAFLEWPEVGAVRCVVTDLQMPGVTGLELQKALRMRGIDVPMVFVTGFGTVSSSVQAMRDGAVDFLEKPADPAALLDAVERAVAKGASLMARAELSGEIRRRQALLTAREQQVFEGVVQGLPNKQIAAQLGIALKTVKVHRGRVMLKMEAQSVADLVRFAEALGGS